MISSLEVFAGLKMLSKRINPSTRLGHASDFEAAISVFKLLREHGYEWSGDEVRDWASGGGWDPEDVAELGTVALRRH